MRVALVHDYLTQFGGAERVLNALMEVFPNAPVFTLVHSDKSNIPDQDKWRLRSSFLQKLSPARKYHHYFPLLMPLAAEAFDAREYDVVLSASHSFGKGIVTGPKTLHICYCFTPTRYLWDDSHRYIKDFASLPWLSKLAPVGLSYLRLWDFYAAQRVDHYITSSNFVAKRIKKYYQRDASVIAPPVDIEAFKRARDYKRQDYYLVVSRLLPYKRCDLAIKACSALKRPLKIVGTGPELKRLKKLAAGHDVEFLGFVPDEDLPALYAQAKGLLFPQEEDFGLTPLEALASGTPTVAYAAGGALETVIDGETGVHYHEQNELSLQRAMLHLEEQQWHRAELIAKAERWQRDRFIRDIRQEVALKWQEHAKLSTIPARS